MTKFDVNDFLREEIRAIVPFKTKDGKNERIEIKNPTEEVKSELLDMIYKGLDDDSKKKSNDELIKYLFDELTNIDLKIPISELGNMEISYELECTLYHITSILNEIMTVAYMNTDAKLSQIINQELMASIDNKLEEVQKIKNLN